MTVGQPAGVVDRHQPGTLRERVLKPAGRNEVDMSDGRSVGNTSVSSGAAGSACRPVPVAVWAGEASGANTHSNAWVFDQRGHVSVSSTTVQHWTGKRWTRPGRLVDGHWTKTPVPKRSGQQPGIDELAWIPGTRSLWATGGFDADAGEVILKYGP